MAGFYEMHGGQIDHNQISTPGTLKPGILRLLYLRPDSWYWLFLLALWSKCLYFGFQTFANGSVPYLLHLPLFWYASLFFTILLLAPAFLLSGPKRLAFLLVIDILLSILLVADIWHYRAFQDYISWQGLNRFQYLRGVTPTLTSLLEATDIIFGIDLIIWPLLYKRVKPSPSANPALFWLTACLAVVMVIIPYLPQLARKAEHNDRTFHPPVSVDFAMQRYSVVGYHLRDLLQGSLAGFHNKGTNRVVLTGEQKAAINNWYAHRAVETPNNKYQGILDGKNLIMIQVESLETFPIGLQLGGQEVTPNLNRMLKNAWFYDHMYEQVKDGTSSDAELIANTSLFPLRSGSAFIDYPYNTYPTLAGFLAEKGYGTTAIHAESGTYFNWTKAASSLGYQACIDAAAFKYDEIIFNGLSDESFFRQALPIVTKQKTPFFCELVTLSGHAPFDIPKAKVNIRLDDELENSIVGDYLEAMNYTDRSIGQLMTDLQEADLDDNTVIVLYGDHTSLHRYYADEVKDLASVYPWLRADDSRVPFIVYSPALEGAVFPQTCGQVDIMPTLAYLFGVDEHKYVSSAMGRNLLNSRADYAVLTNGRVVGGGQDKGRLDVTGLSYADQIIRSNYFAP